MKPSKDDVNHKKNAHLKTEGGRHGWSITSPGKFCTHFGNPAVLYRIRGFASPDLSGFAFFGQATIVRWYKH